MQPWNVKHIVPELEASFAMCRTDLERSCWRVVVKDDIKNLLNGRKPTPGEQSILAKFKIEGV